MGKANTARGEVEFQLGGRTIILKPEHDRGARLDGVLPLGVLGTLVEATQSSTLKVKDMASVIEYLGEATDGKPLPTGANLTGLIFRQGLYPISIPIVRVLSILAGGSEPGEEDAPPSPATGSTGASD